MPRIVLKSAAFVLSLTLCVLLSPEARANLSVQRLQDLKTDATTPAALADYESKAKSFSAAACFPTLIPQNRVKLPGSFEPHLEVGFHTYNVNNSDIANLVETGSSSTPDFFHSLFIKGGLGLPFGFDADLAFAQVVSEHKSSAFSLSIANQVLDFANTVYIDLVPSLTLGGTIMRTFGGPGLYSFTGQSVIGAYHRQSLSQFGFIIQYTYTSLVAMDPAFGSHFFRYGVMSNLPIWKGLTMKTEIFYPSVSAALSVAYQF